MKFAMWQASVFFVWLYFWLRGHWFARVLAFCFFSVFLVICGSTGLLGRDASPAGLAVYVPCALIVAWLAAGLPTYARRPGFWGRVVGLRLPVLYDGAGLRRG